MKTAAISFTGGIAMSQHFSSALIDKDGLLICGPRCPAIFVTIELNYVRSKLELAAEA